jgi:hypothetical protein
MKMMQWQGDAVLGLLARAAVSKKSSGSEGSNQAMMARWAQLSVSNTSLIDLFDDAQVQSLLRCSTLRGKQKADRMEAIIFMLHHLSEDRNVQDWKSDLIRNTLEAIVGALLAIGRKRNRHYFSWTAGTSAKEIREWLVRFQCDRADTYTHSSLFGAKDFTTNTGRLNFPDTEPLRLQLEEKLVALYHLGCPACYVEMATPAYPFLRGYRCDEQHTRAISTLEGVLVASSECAARTIS